MKYTLIFLTLLCAIPMWAANAPAGGLSPELAAKVSRYTFEQLPDGTPYLNCGKAVAAVLGPMNGLPNQQTILAIATALAERVPAGGAIYLGQLPDGTLDLRRIKDHIAISSDGQTGVTLGGGQQDLQLFGVNANIQPGVDGDTRPLRRLNMLYGNIGRISGDVVDSSFVAAVNAWGSYGFRADARIDNSLFLWFSTNWSTEDYNAHLKSPEIEWWKKDCQVFFDLKGGGKNTRVYQMIETNYGNPGTGVWLENCNGLAMYHGATERASSQGPGVYYLHNCTNVQLGLRRIFPGTRGGGRSAMPSHAITIDGGSGNTLHLFTDYANAYQESLVNNDPKLQIWQSELDYEAKGVESPDILKFAFTPLNNVPEGDMKKAADAFAERNAAKWIGERARSGQPNTPENVEQEKALIKSGRDNWWPLNAKHEDTFRYAGQDCTQDVAKLAAGHKLPPPPSIPATNAPREFRPLYQTWERDFGQALLDAGADPTGRTPSDDAFAQVMFGMKADEAAKLLKAVWEQQDKSAYDRLFPIIPGKRERRVSRPRVDIPAGTFLLTRTLLLGPGSNGMLGAGPEKTVLKFQGDIVGVKQTVWTGLANLTIQGGRTGLAITGIDHNDPDGMLTKSYVAGQNFYNITFRDQTFAGIHIGWDDPETMGGAEFDQNKFVNLKFFHTGDYGIYINTSMLDKWLCLNGEFVGQHKAGIAVKFNNLIHGGVYNCRFSNINGPGIDFMGGNPTLCFLPYIVMIDQCDFTECGNATRAAVDYGYCELAAITRCAIVTKTKEIACGLVGAAQQYEDVRIDVNLVGGGSALLLRAVRNGQTARANGHILRDVTANGPVNWINDVNAHNAGYRKTLEKYQALKLKADGTVDLNWDTNAAAHELAPPNGWVHPFLIYNSTLGGKRYAYTLLNVDVDHNKVLKAVDLSDLAK